MKKHIQKDEQSKNTPNKTNHFKTIVNKGDIDVNVKNRIVQLILNYCCV